MAVRSAAGALILIFSLGVLLAPVSKALAQAQADPGRSVGFSEAVAAAAAAALAASPPSEQARQASFSFRLNRVLTEPLQRPSAFAPAAPAATRGTAVQGLEAMLERARQPHAAREASARRRFSLDDLVTRSLFSAEDGVRPVFGAERDRRRALVDSLRMALPSDSDIFR